MGFAVQVAIDGRCDLRFERVHDAFAENVSWHGEVGATVARLRELGYTHDRDGAPLERDDQLLELRVQDLVLNDACGDYLLRTAHYLDDLLERLGHAPDCAEVFALQRFAHVVDGVFHTSRVFR